jgi:hypothetical protein
VRFGSAWRPADLPRLGLQHQSLDALLGEVDEEIDVPPDRVQDMDEGAGVVPL